MAFTLEDGTGISGANSYAAVDYFRGYHTDRGRTADAGTYPDATVQAALIRATDFVEKRFGSRWIGTARISTDQGLSFPRSNVYVDGIKITGLPVQLQQGVSEYAWRALQVAELAPDPPVPFSRDDASGSEVEAGGALIRSRERIEGAIDTEYEYASGSEGVSGVERIAGRPIPVYPAADMLLSPLLVNTRRTIR